MGYTRHCDCPRDPQLNGWAVDVLSLYHRWQHAGYPLAVLAEGAGISRDRIRRACTEGQFVALAYRRRAQGTADTQDLGRITRATYAAASGAARR